MNVTELARRLKMTTRELLELLPQLGFAIGKRAIKIDPNLVDKITQAVEEHRRKKKISSQEKYVREIKLDDKKTGVVAAREQRIVKIPEIVVVKDLADRLGLPVTKVIGELMKNGILANINQMIDFETLKSESRKLLLRFIVENPKPIRLVGLRVKVE